MPQTSAQFMNLINGVRTPVNVPNGNNVWTGTNTFNQGISVPYSGSLWTNQVTPAVVSRLDRLFVSAATINSGDNPVSTNDWLNALVPASTVSATFAALAPQALSGTGILGGASTLNAPATSNAVGIASWGINNGTSALNQSAWAFYGEAWKTTADNVGIFTTAMELDIVNKSTLVIVDPFSAPSGETFGLLIASGGSRSGVGPASSAMYIGPNGSTFNNGIVFANGSLTSSGGTAIALPQSYAIAWYSGAATIASAIIGGVSGLQLQGLQTAANGSVGTVLGSVGPTGSHTTVQDWLVVTDAGGNTRYIPCF